MTSTSQMERMTLQPDSGAADKDIYASSYGVYSSANYSAIYTCSTRDTRAKTPETDPWNGVYDYAYLPRLSSKGEHNPPYKSRSKKHDYQDVYKDRKDKREGKSKLIKSSKSVDGVSSENTIPPFIPCRKYDRNEETNPKHKDAVQEEPPRIAPIGGYIGKVGNFTFHL